jgi:DNA helicase MCM8
MASQLAAPRPPQWGVYFPGDAYAADDRRALLVRELAAFFGAPAGAALLARARPWHGRAVLPLDWAALAAAEGAPRDLPEALRHAPGEALACLAVAAHAFLLPRSAAAGDDDDETDANAAGEPPRVLVRLANHAESFTKVSDVRADSVGRLVTLRGTVTRATPARPLVVACDFSCAKCGAAQRARFADGRFAPPPICGVDGCRSPRLAPVRASAAAVDWRRVALQGLPADERPAQGRVPAQLEVELLEELASAATPGDVVAVTGIVRVLAGAAGGRAASGGGGDAAKRQCLFVPYVEALSVAAAGAAAGGGFAGGAAAGGEVVAQPEGPSYLPPGMPGFTALDLRFIRAFAAGAAGGDALRQLARSLAPGLCGMEGPKAGLVLALLGGARKGGGGGALPLRADVHVLLVGDPGLGKSALLRAAAAAAPRGVYVCGPRVSAAGLTASATRVDGGFAFDAGALALADRGACCVDEFDKVG